MTRLSTVAAAALLLVSTHGAGEFVPDEFNLPTLGSQWTWQDSVPGGSLQSLTGSHFSLKAIEGADMWFETWDNYTYLQQDAPSGTNWEVVVKLDNFDPSEVGRRNNWNKCGITLWQDNDHWFGVWVIGNDGNPVWERRVEGSYQSDFMVNRLSWEHCGDQAMANTANPIWLKIQKTQLGYFGLFSTDGTNWTHVNRMIRNSENASTGYFTNEKIRLIMSGPGTNGTNDTAEFDYIRTNTITPPLSGPASDEFDGTSLNAALWGTHEGIEPGTIGVSGGALRITPANWNDQWGGVDKAIRVYQEAPLDSQWSFTAKVAPGDLTAYQSWTGYGIMLWQDQNDYVMIENVRTNTGTNMIQAVYQRNNANDWNVDETNVGSSALPSYLRISKDGATYSASHSIDNLNFTTLGSYTYPGELQNPQIQLFGKKINADGGSQMTAEFDWVHINSPSEVSDWSIY